MTPTTPLSTLVRDIQSLTPQSPPRRVREVHARARRFNRADLLPIWMLAPAPSASAPAPAPAAHCSSQPIDPEPSLAAKARASRIPLPVLRDIYCREMSNPDPPPLPPGMTLHDAAEARVNTFIRAANGDITAMCTQDADLLSRLNC